MFDTIAQCDERMIKVVGGARTGKTEALISRCAHLITSGQEPKSILVATASAFATQEFRTRLTYTLPESDADKANEVTIITAREACVRALNTPEARATTGRVPRLLMNAEYNFLLEDMKTLGQPIRRLRGMLAFFYQQWALGTPEDTWLPGGEERAVYDHLVESLTLREAMLAQEAPMLLANYLQSDAGACGRAAYSVVLADDFHNLTKTEQTCLCLLADRQIIVAGNSCEISHANSNYPYPEGFERFDELRHGVRTFTLNEAFGREDIQSFADAFLNAPNMDASRKALRVAPSKTASKYGSNLGLGIQLVKWNTPEDEINGITKYLRVLADGERDVAESRIGIVVANKRWARFVERALKQRGFAVSLAGVQSGIGGDPRESKKAEALVAYTKLALLANQYDMVSWRSWCGFDNYLTNSDAWAHLETFARDEGLSLFEALAKLDAECKANASPFLRAEVLAEHFAAGQEFISKNSGRKGFALVRALGATKLPEFSDVVADMDGDEDAETLFALMRTHITNPAFPQNPHTVHVLSYDALCGTEYDTLVLLGTVDGFIPKRDAFEVVSTDADRTRIMDAERCLFHAAAAKATRRLIVSYFSTSPLELAERTKMQVLRVRSERTTGERVAIVRPTSFLGEAGDATPSTTGGQAFLGALGLN